MSCNENDRTTSQSIAAEQGAQAQSSRDTYIPRPVSETRVRTLIHAAIVQAGSGNDPAGRAFRPAI